MLNKLYFILSIISVTLSVQAQEVLVSSDISIRNNLSYDIIGEIEDRIVLFRDAGDEYFMETFDEEMTMVFSTSIVFEQPKVDIYNILGLDSTFQILYGYPDQDSIRIKSRRYDPKAILIDSVSLFTIEKKLFKRYKYVNSEDGSKTLLFAKARKDILELFWIDNKRNKLIASQNHSILNINLNEDFRFMDLTNDGRAITYFDTDNFQFTKENHFGHLFVFSPYSITPDYYPLNYDSKVAIDFKMEFNNINNHFVLAGLYSTVSNSSAEGYFLINKDIDQIQEKDTFSFTQFPREFISEVIGVKKKRVNLLNDFVIKDLTLRADGGVLMFFESYKEFARRSTYRSYTRRDASLYGDRGWVDYYNEDIIVVATHPEGDEHWKKVLHKKQFSQDDEAIFSSFYIFKTPSRLRLIYNDDITKNSTISEYLVDPIGDYERRSLLNTEYENLKLRFNDSIQLSSNSMIVPSQQSYTLNLVKITY